MLALEAELPQRMRPLTEHPDVAAVRARQRLPATEIRFSPSLIVDPDQIDEFVSGLLAAVDTTADLGGVR